MTDHKDCKARKKLIIVIIIILAQNGSLKEYMILEVRKITAKVNKNQIDITGSNKELVGFVAATVRGFRPPEPYKGKGLKYLTETIIRKAGKTGAKK